ncbi:hypothetical protein KCH_77040 [Kitasatospora cheerisanensis KCTC 2395]|uniref:Uncharacterized protein n=2 Tax=Kitasatospora cheerisanensis TaxID=81942 RepID=A0A066YHE3_9ACTN|nr:hypothetical protein KCH_77040 [Kitasatospora cheerisanensis KCTC 2395]
MDQALADPKWLRERLAEAESGRASRIREWGRAALERARIDLCWAVTATGTEATDLEERVQRALVGKLLWNRQTPN